jgi:hypothetical protein
MAGNLWTSWTAITFERRPPLLKLLNVLTNTRSQIGKRFVYFVERMYFYTCGESGMMSIIISVHAWAKSSSNVCGTYDFMVDGYSWIILT